ncbi:SDR family oxidoreductase [Spirosoma luteolum]
MGVKRAVITGANSGLGLATAKALAQRSFDLVLVCRSEERGRVAQADVQKANPAVQVDLITADLGNLESVRTAADTIAATYDRIDVLVNNAGYTPAAIEFTPEGIEKSFYASHLGHFVLTNRLIDTLKKTAAQTGDVRIINLSSAAHLLGRKARMFRHIDNLSTWAAYGDDKLANALFARALAQHLAGTGITSYSVHPGAVRTSFGSDTPGFVGQLLKLAGPLMRTPEKGAQTSVFLASAPLKAIGESNNGGYFADSRPKGSSNRDLNDANAEWLWQQSVAYL